MRRVLTLSGSALVLLAGCTAIPKAPPLAPAPVPVPAPAPPPAPVLGPDWRDWPLTPGSWSYRQEAGGSVAAFGNPAAPDFMLRCDRARGQIVLARLGGGVAQMPMAITTTTATRELTAQASGGYMAAMLGARDTLADAMGFSRGRFVVKVGALAPLVLPSWAEVLRVVEDCR